MRSATKRRVGKDPEYLKWLHALPCVVCEAEIAELGYSAEYLRQLYPTEAAHVGTRGLSQKCPDRQAIPLCSIRHHREGELSAHRIGRRFFDVHGLDRDAVIAQLLARYEQERSAAA